MTDLREKGSHNFRQQLSASATEAVKEHRTFEAEPDPVHGDKPKLMVQKFATKTLGILEMAPDAELQAQAAGGSRFAGAFNKISSVAAGAAATVATAAHEAGELAAAQAEKARQEMERRQLEQQRTGNTMLGSAIAEGGTLADIVARVDTKLAQDRDTAVAEVEKLNAELKALQAGAMMQMHRAVVSENENLKAKVEALQAQVGSLTAANQAAQAQVAAAKAGSGAAAPDAVQEAVPPTADVDALLSGFGAPAAATPAPTPAAAPDEASATAAPAATAATEEAASAAAAGPTRAELAAQVSVYTFPRVGIARLLSFAHSHCARHLSEGTHRLARTLLFYSSVQAPCAVCLLMTPVHCSVMIASRAYP